MCHCSNPPAQYVKCQFYCTAQLNVLQRLKPAPISRNERKHQITVFSKHQYTTQQCVMVTQVLNKIINFKAKISGRFIGNLLFMCDVQTVAMYLLVITDMPATVTA